MNWDLDMIGALICGAMAATFFTLHALTSARHQNTVTLPEHLRIGIMLAGVLSMVRAVNFLTLPNLDSHGHANAEAVLTGAVLLYVLISTAFWAEGEFTKRRAAEAAREGQIQRLTTRR